MPASRIKSAEVVGARARCVFAAILLIASSSAYAWHGGIDEGLELEREKLRSQEEQKREAGRAKRRDELERSKKATGTEREANYDDILQSSEASLRAPQGVYYRKPGFMSSEVPEGRTVVVTGVTYRYE